MFFSFSVGQSHVNHVFCYYETNIKLRIVFYSAITTELQVQVTVETVPLPIMTKSHYHLDGAWGQHQMAKSSISTITIRQRLGYVYLSSKR